MLNFYDFIQVFVFTTNLHLNVVVKSRLKHACISMQSSYSLTFVSIDSVGSMHVVCKLGLLSDCLNTQAGLYIFWSSVH